MAYETVDHLLNSRRSSCQASMCVLKSMANSSIAYLFVTKPRQQLFIVVAGMCSSGRKIGIGG